MVTLISRTQPDIATVHVPPGATAHLIVEHLGDLLLRADAVLTRERFTFDTFTKADAYQLPVHERFDATVARVRSDLRAFAHRSPDRSELSDAFTWALDAAAQRGSIADTETTYRAALTVFTGAFGPEPTGDSLAQVRFASHGLIVDLQIDHPRRADGAENYLTAVRALTARRRDAEENFRIDERIAVRAGYWLLDRGVHVRGDFPSWGTSGFRDVQTYASITDPGEGHLAGTTRYLGFLHGVIVHVEHLERGVDRSREELEPYRMPSPRTVARVRLHTGDAAPTSSYIGRPLLDGTVEDSLIKTSRTFAAAASSLLADGLAEVKFAVERLTATEAITLLRALAQEVRRDRHAQILAAAFNINTPILDDRPETVAEHGEAVWARTAEQIGLLGVQIVTEGGFDKVTWDGTADTYPSRCITDQLTPPVALTLVHRAHEHGLLTYFSAGFRFANIPDAVVTGVDGIGIGGAQILRYMDKTTGNHGPFLPDNIHRILAVRDEAAASLHGRAAQLLARLDRLHFEGSIETHTEPLRQELFTAPCDREDTKIDQLAQISPAGVDTEHPLIAWARRLLDSPAPLAATRVGTGEWLDHRDKLNRALVAHDLVGLSDLLHRISAPHAVKHSTPTHT